MRVEIFHIKYPETAKGRSSWSKRYGLNALYSTSKNRWERTSDKDFWHTLVMLELNRCRIKRAEFTAPARITFLWDDGLDIDNHAYMGKMIVDALKGYLLHDDSRKWLVEVRHRFHDEKRITVIVEEVAGR